MPLRQSMSQDEVGRRHPCAGQPRQQQHDRAVAQPSSRRSSHAAIRRASSASDRQRGSRANRNWPRRELQGEIVTRLAAKLT